MTAIGFQHSVDWFWTLGNVLMRMLLVTTCNCLYTVSGADNELTDPISKSGGICFVRLAAIIVVGRSALCDSFIHFQDMVFKSTKTQSEILRKFGFRNPVPARAHSCPGRHLLDSRVAFRLTCFACRKTRSCKKRRSEMSGQPVGHLAAWLLRYALA